MKLFLLLLVAMTSISKADLICKGFIPDARSGDPDRFPFEVSIHINTTNPLDSKFDTTIQTNSLPSEEKIHGKAEYLYKLLDWSQNNALYFVLQPDRHNGRGHGTELSLVYPIQIINEAPLGYYTINNDDFSDSRRPEGDRPHDGSFKITDQMLKCN